MIHSAPQPEAWTWRTLDPRLSRVANRWTARRAIRQFFSIISRLGDGWFWYGLMLVLAIFEGQRGVDAALQMACTGLLVWLLYRALKRHTRRPRPFRVHADVVAGAAVLDEYSFPSGHTLQAVSFTMVAALWFPWLALLLIPFTVLVALSRVVLGLHYPTDVLAGLLIGAALGAASVWACTAFTAVLV